MVCSKCSFSNDSDALFCSECGTAIIKSAKESPARARRSYLYALFLIPVIAIAGGIGYYKFFLPYGIAAFVNGEGIKIPELDAAVARLKAVYGQINSEGVQAEQQMRRLRYHVLNGLITERMILQEAEKSGIIVADQDLAAAIEQRRQSSGLDKDGFSSAIIRQYGSVPLFEEAVKRELVTNKFLAEKVIPKDTDARAAGARVDDWIRKLYSRAAVRITLSEQLSGASCGCRGSESGPRKAPECNRETAKPPKVSPDTHATDAAVKYWHEKHGPRKVATKITDYGCHVQIDIIKDNKIIGSLRYQGGKISE